MLLHGLFLLQHCVSFAAEVIENARVKGADNTFISSSHFHVNTIHRFPVLIRFGGVLFFVSGCLTSTFESGIHFAESALTGNHNDRAHAHGHPHGRASKSIVYVPLIVAFAHIWFVTRFWRAIVNCDAVIGSWSVSSGSTAEVKRRAEWQMALNFMLLPLSTCSKWALRDHKELALASETLVVVVNAFYILQCCFILHDMAALLLHRGLTSDVDLTLIFKDITTIPGVVEIVRYACWALEPNRIMLLLQLRVSDTEDPCVIVKKTRKIVCSAFSSQIVVECECEPANLTSQKSLNDAAGDGTGFTPYTVPSAICEGTGLIEHGHSHSHSHSHGSYHHWNS